MLFIAYENDDEFHSAKRKKNMSNMIKLYFREKRRVEN